MTRQQQIIEKNWVNPLDIKNTGKLLPAMKKMLDEWGVEVVKAMQWHGNDFHGTAKLPMTTQQIYNQLKRRIRGTKHS